MAEQSDELFKDFNLEKEEKKKKNTDEEIEIRFRLSRKTMRWMERCLYYLAIIILLVLVFKPSGDCAADSPVEEAPATSLVVNTTPTPKVTQPVVVNPPKEVKEDPLPEEIESEPEVATLSGVINMTIGEIKVSRTDSGAIKVDSIFLSIRNEKALFKPKVRIFWYTVSTDAAVKGKARSEYTYPSLIPTGIATARKLDEELESHFIVGYKTSDNKLFVMVELLDSKDNSIILTEKKNIAI